MKQTTIQFTYEDSKLNAIRFYLTAKNSELDTELQAFMNTLYRKNVPAQVRDFIEQTDGPSNPEQQRPSRRSVSPRKATCDEVSENGADIRPSEENAP